MITLNNARFRGPGRDLASVERQLKDVLEFAGYVEVGYFCVPNGFALATRLERIKPDKTPYKGDPRWQPDKVPLLDFNRGVALGDLVRALFRADPGRYRMIIFYVTDQPVTPGETPPTDSLRDLPSRGGDELPERLGDRPYSSAYRVRVLVYEFARPSVSAPANFVRNTLPARIHLQRAGLWQRLGQ